MIDEVRSLVDEYAAWLRDKTTLRQLNDEWVEVTTPYLDRHNDHLQFFVRRTEEGLTLTDDGYIIRDLETSGCDLSSKRRQEALRTVLNGFGVRNDGDALTVVASPQDFAQKKHRLIQAMLAVNDLFSMSQATVAALFLDDVSHWLHNMDVRFTPGIKLSGSSGYDHTFDFIIPASRVAPERIVQTINRPTKDRIEATAFAWIDTRNVRRPDSRAYVFLNDRGGSPPRGAMAALRTYDITAVPWGKRDSVRDELAA